MAARPDRRWPPRTRSEEISLRDYLEHRIDAAAAQLGVRIDSAAQLVDQSQRLLKEAVSKAEHAQAERNAIANEFRASLGDVSKQQVSAVVFEATIRDLQGRIEGEARLALARTDAKEKAIAERLDMTAERMRVIENGYANLQGRFWMLGSGLAIAVLVLEFALKYLK